MKRALQISLLGVLVLASGCAGLTPSDTPTSSVTTTTEERVTTEERTTTEATTVDSTTTRTLPRTVGDDPQKGDDLLSVSNISESEAEKANASERSEFRNLTEPQQRAFELALECDCNVVQDAFTFNDEDRIKVVAYDGRYYYVRVAIV